MFAFGAPHTQTLMGFNSSYVNPIPPPSMSYSPNDTQRTSRSDRTYSVYPQQRVKTNTIPFENQDATVAFSDGDGASPVDGKMFGTSPWSTPLRSQRSITERMDVNTDSKDAHKSMMKIRATCSAVYEQQQQQQRSKNSPADAFENGSELRTCEELDKTLQCLQDALHLLQQPVSQAPSTNTNESHRRETASQRPKNSSRTVHGISFLSSEHLIHRMAQFDRALHEYLQQWQSIAADSSRAVLADIEELESAQQSLQRQSMVQIMDDMNEVFACAVLDGLRSFNHSSASRGYTSNALKSSLATPPHSSSVSPLRDWVEASNSTAQSAAALHWMFPHVRPPCGEPGDPARGNAPKREDKGGFATSLRERNETLMRHVENTLNELQSVTTVEAHSASGLQSWAERTASRRMQMQQTMLTLDRAFHWALEGHALLQMMQDRLRQEEDATHELNRLMRSIHDLLTDLLHDESTLKGLLPVSTRVPEAPCDRRRIQSAGYLTCFEGISVDSTSKKSLRDMGMRTTSPLRRHDEETCREAPSLEDPVMEAAVRAQGEFLARVDLWKERFCGPALRYSTLISEVFDDEKPILDRDAVRPWIAMMQPSTALHPSKRSHATRELYTMLVTALEACAGNSSTRGYSNRRACGESPRTSLVPRKCSTTPSTPYILPCRIWAALGTVAHHQELIQQTLDQLEHMYQGGIHSPHYPMRFEWTNHPGHPGSKMDQNRSGSGMPTRTMSGAGKLQDTCPSKHFFNGRDVADVVSPFLKHPMFDTIGDPYDAHNLPSPLGMGYTLTASFNDGTSETGFNNKDSELTATNSMKLANSIILHQKQRPQRLDPSSASMKTVQGGDNLLEFPTKKESSSCTLGLLARAEARSTYKPRVPATDSGKGKQAEQGNSKHIPRKMNGESAANMTEQSRKNPAPVTNGGDRSSATSSTIHTSTRTFLSSQVSPTYSPKHIQTARQTSSGTAPRKTKESFPSGTTNQGQLISPVQSKQASLTTKTHSTTKSDKEPSPDSHRLRSNSKVHHSSGKSQDHFGPNAQLALPNHKQTSKPSCTSTPVTPLSPRVKPELNRKRMQPNKTKTTSLSPAGNSEAPALAPSKGSDRNLALGHGNNTDLVLESSRPSFVTSSTSSSSRLALQSSLQRILSSRGMEAFVPRKTSSLTAAFAAAAVPRVDTGRRLIKKPSQPAAPTSSQIQDAHHAVSSSGVFRSTSTQDIIPIVNSEYVFPEDLAQMASDDDRSMPRPRMSSSGRDPTPHILRRVSSFSNDDPFAGSALDHAGTPDDTKPSLVEDTLPLDRPRAPSFPSHELHAQGGSSGPDRTTQPDPNDGEDDAAPFELPPEVVSNDRGSVRDRAARRNRLLDNQMLLELLS